MLAHGGDELMSLAAECVIEALPAENGWEVDRWLMTEDDVTASVALYDAVIAGDPTEVVSALLLEYGVDISALLSAAGKDEITRSDLTELAAAASLAKSEGFNSDQLHMPNVPKMSRRKSDSGIDILVVELDGAAVGNDLQLGERLTAVSVKHSVSDSSTSGLRWKLEQSLRDGELPRAYLAAQLRVLQARLKQEGLTADAASRVYLFLRDFPELAEVSFYAIGVASDDLQADFAHHITLLGSPVHSNQKFRMILMPGLRDVHTRCT